MGDAQAVDGGGGGHADQLAVGQSVADLVEGHVAITALHVDGEHAESTTLLAGLAGLLDRVRAPLHERRARGRPPGVGLLRPRALLCRRVFPAVR